VDGNTAESSALPPKPTKPRLLASITSFVTVVSSVFSSHYSNTLRHTHQEQNTFIRDTIMSFTPSQETKSKARIMRELLQGPKPLVSCGVYDGYSALMVEAMGFKCAATTGAGLANSVLGVPDIGIFSLRDNVDVCRNIAKAVSIPIMADADTGYGNAVTVYHVVQYFEDAGIVGINMEDQLMPKRCGHMRGKELVETSEMVQKIESAIRAKKDQDFILNARTDAIAVEGIEGTVIRVREYVAAGADMIYADAIRSEDDIARVVEAARGTPVSVNMGFGLRARPTSPLISLTRLAELGVARVSLPRFLPAAALHGMQQALIAMKACMETGELEDRPDLLVDIGMITNLVGYERINELENSFLTDEQITKKYGEGERDYVVKNKGAH
jgi:2-methylisocitrate lyase-like PEP mutase family enzyme